MIKNDTQKQDIRELAVGQTVGATNYFGKDK